MRIFINFTILFLLSFAVQSSFAATKKVTNDFMKQAIKHVEGQTKKERHQFSNVEYQDAGDYCQSRAKHCSGAESENWKQASLPLFTQASRSINFKNKFLKVHLPPESSSSTFATPSNHPSGSRSNSSNRRNRDKGKQISQSQTSNTQLVSSLAFEPPKPPRRTGNRGGVAGYSGRMLEGSKYDNSKRIEAKAIEYGVDAYHYMKDINGNQPIRKKDLICATKWCAEQAEQHDKMDIHREGWVSAHNLIQNQASKMHHDDEVLESERDIFGVDGSSSNPSSPRSPSSSSPSSSHHSSRSTSPVSARQRSPSPQSRLSNSPSRGHAIEDPIVPSSSSNKGKKKKGRK